jgi:hypothetical protein
MASRRTSSARLLPYHLSPDLLAATFAALSPPPVDTPSTWREARVARLMQEFATLIPANAAQAQIVSQILIMREMVDGRDSGPRAGADAAADGSGRAGLG